MSNPWTQVFQPGFFSNQSVGIAIVVGGLAALVCGFAGVITVIRGQSFSGHSLADVSTTGGSGAVLVQINPLLGFVLAAVLGAGAMDVLGGQRSRSRDVATGIVLGAALGVTALFLYLESTLHNTTGASVAVLFGSIFAVSLSAVPLVVAFSIVSVAIVLPLYRPLLLSAVSADMARARGVPVRMFGALYLIGMALAVSVACLTVGAILSTALLIGPAATALRVTKRPGIALALSSGIGIIATWLGILLAYDSYDWPPHHQSWPVSFFIVAVVFLFYVMAGLPIWRRDSRSIRSISAEPA